LEIAPGGSDIDSAIRRDIALWQRQLVVFDGGIAGNFAAPFAISQDSQRLAVVSGSAVRIYSTSTGNLEEPVCEIEGYCEWLRFTTPDSLLVAYRPENAWSPETPAVVLAWDCKAGARVIERPSILPLMFDESGQRVLLHTDQTARLYQADTLEVVGAELLLPKSQLGSPGTVSLSPDGKRFASCIDRRLDVWDTISGDPIQVPDSSAISDQPGPRSLAWSPDGTRLALVSRETIVSLNLAELKSVQLQSSDNFHVAFSIDGSRLGVLAGRSFQLWGPDDAKPIGDPIPLIDPIPRNSPNSEERRLTPLRDDREALIAEVTSSHVIIRDRAGEALLSIPTLMAPRPAVREGRFLWNFGELTDVESGHRVGQPLKPLVASTVFSEVLFAPTSAHLFTLTVGEGLSAFAKPQDRVAINRWRLPQAFDPSPMSGRPAGISDDGRFVLISTGLHGQQLQLWDLDMQSRKGELITLEVLQDRFPPPIAAVSPDGGTVAIFHLAQGKLPSIRIYLEGRSDPAHEFELVGERGVTRLLFSPDGRELLALGIRGAVHRFDTNTWRSVGPPLRAQVGNPASSVVFDPSGRTFIVLYFQESQLWDRETGEPIGPVFRRSRGVDSAIYHPEAEFLVTNDIVDSILFDLGSGAPLSHGSSTMYSENSSLMLEKQELQPRYPDLDDPLPFRILDFNHSGSLMAATDGAIDAPFVQIRDARTGHRIGPRLRHAANVSTATFSPDGRYLATLSAGALRIWETKTGDPVGPPRGIAATRMAFSSDSTMLATDHDLWHVASGMPIGPKVRVGECQIVRFTPNGRRVIRIGGGFGGFGPGMGFGPSIDIQEIPDEVVGEVDVIRARVESNTGRQLDAFGAVWPIEPSEIPSFGMGSLGR
jgi:WD40 repeat protein